MEPGTDEYRRLDVALSVARGLYESSMKHVKEVSNAVSSTVGNAVSNTMPHVLARICFAGTRLLACGHARAALGVRGRGAGSLPRRSEPAVPEDVGPKARAWD